MEMKNPTFNRKVADNLIELICVCAMNSRREMETFSMKNPSFINVLNKFKKNLILNQNQLFMYIY